jgi:hypothetical protein
MPSGCVGKKIELNKRLIKNKGLGIKSLLA